MGRAKVFSRAGSVVAAAALAAGLMVGGCEGWGTVSGGGDGEPVQLVKTELGGCNVNAAGPVDLEPAAGAVRKAANNSWHDATSITVSKDLVTVSTGVYANCGFSFGTRHEVKDGVLYMYLVGDCPALTNCGCNFIFDFVFKKHGALGKPYKILFTHDREGTETLVSEGTISER